jgi:hypothetical protein
MAKAQKPAKPSNDSQRLTENAWYYEYRGRIDVVVWVTEPRTGFHTATTVRIPWSKLLRSAARCGKIASNEGKRRRKLSVQRSPNEVKE